MTLAPKLRRGRKCLPRSVPPATLAALVLRLRAERDWSVRDLSSASGIDYGFVASIERGYKPASLNAAARLATALGADAAEFVRLVLQERLDAAGVRLRVAVHAGDETVWSAEREAWESDCRTLGEPFAEGKL